MAEAGLKPPTDREKGRGGGDDNEDSDDDVEEDDPLERSEAKDKEWFRDHGPGEESPPLCDDEEEGE